MKILVGTPAYDKSVTTIYLGSLLRMLDYFRRKKPNVEFQVLTVSTALITAARNVCASIVLQDPSYTHLLFIDSDMGFSPSLIARMLAFDKPLTGCVYPKRGLDYAEFHKIARQISDPRLARVLAQDYVGGGSFMELEEEKRPGSQGTRKIHRLKHGFVRARRAGTGIMMVKREVFERVREQYPELWVPKCGHYYEQMGVKGGVLQCFECYPGKNGLYIGEDFAFCDRWVRGCKGDIWCCVDEEIIHYGQHEYFGQYLKKLKAQPMPDTEGDAPRPAGAEQRSNGGRAVAP